MPVDLEKLAQIFQVCCFVFISFILNITILVPLRFINSLVFFYLSELLFSDFLKFKGYFARGQNNST